MRRLTALALAFGLLVAACGGDDAADSTTTTEPEPSTTEAPPATDPGPPTSPADVVFAAQESDGSSITVSSVTLPAPGFIAVHANAEGAPGPIIGNSDLLPEGTSTDVVVLLDTPLESTDLLFPMAHIDMDGNGEYEFAPPDNAIDIPATTADGSVAVVGAEVTVVSADAGALVAVAASELGEILVDGEGNTLYLFTPDQQGESTCYDQCESAWPPLVGEVTAGDGADPALVGSTIRTDGTVQVTYNDWPLYYFAGDEAPGDTNGQGLNDVWFVVAPSGEAIP